jgi:hypothetical protein
MVEYRLLPRDVTMSDLTLQKNIDRLKSELSISIYLFFLDIDFFPTAAKFSGLFTYERRKAKCGYTGWARFNKKWKELNGPKVCLRTGCIYL